MKKFLQSQKSLLLITAVAFLIRIYNLNYNSLFLDEAIYIRLGKEFFAGNLSLQSPYSWVGGMPTFYPPLSEIAYTIGGIMGARFFNVILGTLSVFLVYYFTLNLKLFERKNSLNKQTALISAMFFAVLPVPIFLSRIAIYDTLSFTLFLLGLVFLQKTLIEKDKSKYYFLVIILFFLAFLAKYTIIIFLPFIFLISFFYIWRNKIKKIEEVLFFISSVLIIVGYYIFKHFSDLLQFITQQVINRNSASSSDMFFLFMKTTNFVYIIAVIALCIFVLQKKYKSVLLLFFSLLPLLVHEYTHNTATLQQDTIFTAFFLAPLAASFFGFLSQKNYIIGFYTAVIIILVFFISSASLRIEFENHWPNSTRAMNYLHKNASNSDKILAEADDVAVLALSDKLNQSQVKGPFNFMYKGISGNNAYSLAVKDEYFSYIQLDETVSDFEKAVIPQLRNKYKNVYNDDTFTIYKKIK